MITLYGLMLLFNWVNKYTGNCFDNEIEKEVQKHYFEKVQKMNAKKLKDTHTGYISNLIMDVEQLFVSIVRLFEGSIITLIIGSIAFLVMAYKQSISSGILCVILSIVAIYLKYKMMKNK